VSAATFDVHGVRLVVAADDENVAAAVRERLAHFAVAADGAGDLRFEITVGGRPPSRPLGAGRPVYDLPGGEVAYFDGTGELYIDVGGQACAVAQLGAGTVTTYANPDRADLAWLLSRPLLTLPLLELLKRRGLYNVHAAAAAIDGRAILLAGPSGSGKSTLALACARAEMPLMGDDMVFLARGPDGVRVHAFPDELDVAAPTAELFPGLGSLAGAPEPGWPKHRVRPEALFGTPVADTATPAVIVLPTVAGTKRSALEAIAPGEALVALAPNVLLTAPAASQAHLDAIGELVRASRCYRLATGRDLDHAVRLLRDLVG
jgi:hypothetical protein